MKIVNCEQDSLYTTEQNVEDNRVEFVSNRMLYIVCNVTFLNVHAPSEEITEDTKFCFYEQLNKIINNFPKCDTKILLWEFNAKLERENIFKPTIGNESLHQDSNINGATITTVGT